MKKGLWILSVPLLLSANSLTELIDLSLENEQAKSATMNIRSAKASLEATKNGYLPSFTIGSSYTNTSNERQNGEPKHSTSTYGTISYTIYDGGRKDALIAGSTKNYQATSLSKKNLDNQLVLNTTSIYFNLLSLHSSIEAKEQQIEQLKADQKRLEQFALAGAAAKDEVEKIRADLALSQTQRSQLLLNYRSAQFDLEELTGAFTIPVQGASLKEPMAEKKQVRADIQANEKSVQALLYTAQSEKADLRPQVSIQDTFSFYDREFDPDSGDNSYHQNKMMLSFEWKIFDFGATNKRYEASRLAYERSKKDLELAKRRADIRYAYALKALELAKVTITSSAARLTSANATFDAISKKFKAGIVDNVAYLDALSDKYSAKADLETAKNDYEIRKAEFYYYAGLEIKEMIR